MNTELKIMSMFLTFIVFFFYTSIAHLILLLFDWNTISGENSDNIVSVMYLRVWSEIYKSLSNVNEHFWWLFILDLQHANVCHHDEAPTKSVVLAGWSSSSLMPPIRVLLGDCTTCPMSLFESMSNIDNEL